MVEGGPRLARRFLAGDPHACRAVETWVRTAASPFRRRLGDAWEDAVQEGLLEVTRALREDRVRDLHRLRAWTFRATTHTCLDRLRSRRRWSWVEVDEAGLSAQPSALGRLLEEASVRSLLDVASRCPVGCRRLWAMILAGLSYREMAERTGLAAGTLRVRVLRCRRQAHAIAESLEEGGSCAETVTSQGLERQEESEGRDHDL